MSLTFQQFATSTFGTRLWMILGGIATPHVGRAISRLITGALSRRVDSSLYRTIYNNQAVVLGPGASPAQIHAAVRGVLRHAGQVSYDLMHIVARGEKAVLASIEFGPEVWADMAAARAGGRGVMMCGAHLSNFNLAFLAFAVCGIELQMLSPSTGGGFTLIREIRSRGALVDTPIGVTSLRSALRRLKGGGAALTGADWPIAPGGREVVSFLGRPALMPTGHIRLAMAAGARLLPVAAGWDAARRCYFVRSAPPMELEARNGRATDVRLNAERVLAVLERWIVASPEQWLMYYPVWGGALSSTA